MKLPIFLLKLTWQMKKVSFGITSETTEQLVREISKLEHVRIKGLMTTAIYG